MTLARLQADLLAWVARSRALLAVSIGGSLRSGGPVAVLGAAAGGGGRALWLVRGLPWQIGPAWLACWAFPGAVRSIEPRRPGVLVGDLDGSAALLLCGLCGGAPVGAVDSWLEAHPLSGSRRGADS